MSAQAGERGVGPLEVWAARAWNVFNEGRPFSIVYPAMVLVCAAPVGLASRGPLWLALLGAVALAVVLSRFSFPLRGRALLWLAAAASVPLLEPWRAPGLLLGALAGYLFFTVLLWGTLYYHLRTGAPWSNVRRFWRLVATNSDPTSGNALEQLPKLLMTLGAGTLLAEQDGSLAAIGRIAAVALLSAALGALAWRRFARQRLPRYPERRTHVETVTANVGQPAPRCPGVGAPGLPAVASSRVYVIVVDGANRQRLWQANAPTIDRLAREGTEYLCVEPAYPARTVVCFSSMLTGASPAEHGMRSNFAPRLGVRCESVFDVLQRHGRRGRLVGIAHLLDPFGEDIVRSVTSVQPTERIDHSLTAAARRCVEEEDPDLLVLQLLAADQLGHVRGTRNPEYLDQLAETDDRVGGFLAFLAERGKLADATVILMADHGQGRGIGGHGHMDWGESPVPFVVWGRGALPGTVNAQPRSVCELAVTISQLLGVEAPASARGRPLIPVTDPFVSEHPLAPVADPAAREHPPTPVADRALRERPLVPATGGALAEPTENHPARRCLAIVVARDEAPPLPGVLERLPRTACGMEVDALVVDDGSRDATPELAAAAGARVISHPSSRGLGAALRTGLHEARDRGYAAAVYLDGDGEYDAAELERVLDPVARGRAGYVIGSRFLGSREGMLWHRTLANRGVSALLGSLMGGTIVTDGQSGYRAFSAAACSAAEICHDYNYAQVLTLSLWGAGIDAVEVAISYCRRDGGRSFVGYPEYLARVSPAIWRQWRASTRARASRAQAIPAASAYGQTVSSSNNGSSPVSGPNGASGRGPTRPPSPSSTSR